MPVVIDGFRRSFDKKGLYIKKKEVLQTMKVKAPLLLDFENMDVNDIMDELAFAIEQHPSLIKVKSQD